MGLLTVDHDTIRFGLIVQCFAIFLLYFSCVGAQALQLGLRCQAIDLCPPQQQADINLWVTRWQSGASLCALLVGYSSPGFSVVSGGCSVALISTVLFFWLTQRGSGREGGKPVGTKSLRLLSTPKTIFGAWRSLPQLTKQVCVTQLFSQFSWFPVMHYLSLYLAESYTFTFSTSSKSSIEGAQASIRVILISQSAVLTVQTIAGHIWQSGGRRTGPDNLGHGHLISDDSMIALRKCWGISLICLALCIPSTAVFRNNVHIASLWTCTIQILGFFCNWIPNSIIAYEAASISDSNDESMSGGGEERPEAIMTATTLSIHNTAITVAQILSTIVSGVISWSFQTLAWKHFTWLLFQPGCITALTAAWFAINGHSTVSQGNGYGGSRA
ncbi:hypothetical protein BKA65DRAFT_402919 [Rhexocercosporidium sp. MPI-PUGE-AT-0058]|nr:hypothetical protein BKA65DRAFT_402919 [Rhexocercosporidium sp. MPI-PUGE-AT-0058]